MIIPIKDNLSLFKTYWNSQFNNNINWNLYDFKSFGQNNDLSLISIPSQHKNEIISNLNTNIDQDKIDKIKFFHSDVDIPMIDRSRKILYCFIPKNCCTKFKTLFYAIQNNITSNLDKIEEKIHKHQNIEFLKNDEKFYQNFMSIIQNVEWTKIIIIRDPMARILSFWLDKCIKNEYCEPSWINNFSQLIDDRINGNFDGIGKQGIRDHLMSQINLCGIEYILPFYDHILIYNKDTISHSTNYMLSQMNKTIFQNNNLFAKYTLHSTTNTHKKEIQSMKQYYYNYTNINLMTRIQQLTHKDYQMLPLNPLI